MDVRDVESIPLSYPVAEPYGSARGLTSVRTSTLARVETADGRVGWGDAVGPPRTVAALIDEAVADMARGEDVFEVGSLCERAYTDMYHFGNDGLLQAAVAAVDIALWDLAGKETGRPVAELLGRRRREHVTPYASTMYFGGADRDPAAPVRAAAAEGFTAAKIKIGRGIEDDVARVRAAREALGEDGLLMVDVNGNYRADQAIRSVEAIEPYDIAWLEEPVPPEDLGGYRRVADATSVPVAGGEAAHGRFQFRRLLETGAVDVLQPDLCMSGGLSEGWRIADLATSHGAAATPHCWMSAVGVAASLQFAAALPEYPHGHVPETVPFEFDRADNALREELLEEPLDPTGGTLAVPDGPGLGIEVAEDAVERYRIDAPSA